MAVELSEILRTFSTFSSIILLSSKPADPSAIAQPLVAEVAVSIVADIDENESEAACCCCCSCCRLSKEARELLALRIEWGEPLKGLTIRLMSFIRTVESQVRTRFDS